MRSRSKRGFALFNCVLAAAFALSASVAWPQTYPSKPIRVIVPWPPGGTTDILGRLVAAEFYKAWGQQTFVDNRAGASGTIGADLLAKSPPDGHTIGIVISTVVVNPSLYGKVPYDALKDFVPTAFIAYVTDYVVVHPSLPAKDLKQLVALMKARPGEINFGSAGSGTSTHLAGEAFKLAAGVKINHIPYKGGFPALTDLVGGQLHMMFGNAGSTLPFIRSGKLRVLAVTSAKRVPPLPDTPTVAESGYPGFEVNEWYAMITPAGTPRPIVDKLNAEIARIINQPDLRQRMVNDIGADPVIMKPDEFATFYKTEFDKWAKVIKQAGLKIE
jgi:tripartite-type tricarboxylate transporter receptor subunit TctC